MIMEISKLKRTELKHIDGSNNILYSAVLNNSELIQYTTDGIFHKHITKEEFKRLIIYNYEI